MTMELKLEVQERENLTTDVAVGGMTVSIMPPPAGEDGWSYRVRLSDTQAVVGFPKYRTVGIGFAVETDWNTNLPYHCPTDQIARHIGDNKGDDEISDADVRAAIRMIQLAVIDDRNEQRGDLIKLAREIPSGPVDFGVFDTFVHQVHTMRLEAEMLRADGVNLTERLADLDSRLSGAGMLMIPDDLKFPDDGPRAALATSDEVEADPDMPKGDIPPDEAYRDHNGRIWVAHGGGGAGPRRLYLAGWGTGIEQDTELMTRLYGGVEPVEAVTEPAPPVELPGGGRAFVALLLKLGVPTADGRELLAGGKFEMTEDRPLFRRIEGTSVHATPETVGRLLGLWPVGADVYVFGVADPDVADALNAGELALGGDLECDLDQSGLKADPPVMKVNAARVRGARVCPPGEFAWQS